jgi:hypothetical protein
MAPRAKHVEPEYRKPTNKKGPAQEEKPAGPPEEYDTGQPGQGVHPAAVSSEAGTFHSTPVMGGAAAGVGVALAAGTAEAVLEGDAPSVRVGVGVGVAEGSVQDRVRIF